MNERGELREELYNKLCAVLTCYEQNNEEDGYADEDDLYDMLVEVQRAFNCGII